MPENYIGIMCGTSLDSLDFSLCCFEKAKKLKSFKSFRINQKLKDKINLCKTKPASLTLFKETDTEVTKFIIKCLQEFIVFSKEKKIKAIGYPGITLVHKPDKCISKTLGNPKMLATQTNLKVICDFRLSDMITGGQGAPLAPYFHEYISIKEKAFINILNLGGFANWTFKSNNKLIAYDTGPANYLIDMVSSKYFGMPYDKNGLLAKKGKANDQALLAMLSDSFFDQEIPKSTGFERFNLKWLNKFKSKFKLSNKSSLIATVTQLTIVSVSDAINSNHLDSPYIFFSGGGSKNTYIKKEILKRTGLIEIKSLPYNFNFKNLESSAFAWLAMKRDQGRLISKSYLTGAKSSRKLGVIYR
tara:strand:- start:90 stop:1166 length:1077 start_codon:yes stop_codon:yes gene_type:complete